MCDIAQGCPKEIGNVCDFFLSIKFDTQNVKSLKFKDLNVANSHI